MSVLLLSPPSNFFFLISDIVFFSSNISIFSVYCLYLSADNLHFSIYLKTVYFTSQYTMVITDAFNSLPDNSYIYILLGLVSVDYHFP